MRENIINSEVLLSNGVTFHKHLDRDPVFNVWDNASGIFSAVKSNITKGITSIDEAIWMADRLFQSSDPAVVKTGIHIYRFCMWQNSAVAEEWMKRAEPLFNHGHPRIRHSAVWNLRTASWQDSKFAQTGLEFAQKGLKDTDAGVQRASMWALGDFVVNDPNLFIPAYNSLNQFLVSDPKESNYLFALERFFRSLKIPYGSDPRFQDSIAHMRKESNGYPGLRARSAVLLDDNVSKEEEKIDMELVSKKYRKAVESTALDTVSPDQAFVSTTRDFQRSDTFAKGLNNLRLMKYLVWLSEDLNQPFEVLAQTLSDKRDGDLSRSASVIMADCSIRKPHEIDHSAAEAVKSFFEQSDIDGSQIIVQLVIDPILHIDPKLQTESAKVLPELQKLAVNKSVIFALGVR